MGREVIKNYAKSTIGTVVKSKEKLKKIESDLLSNTDELLSAEIICDTKEVANSPEHGKRVSKIFLLLKYNSESLGPNKTARVEYSRDKYGICK